MYIDELIKEFETTVEKSYPKLINSELISNLSIAITNKKYDIQDQALIESILKEDKESFTESFSESLKSRLEREKEVSEFINSEKGQKEIIDLFIKSLEHTIDFYYNNIISKQFSST